jgi:hypothetical protein
MPPSPPRRFPATGDWAIISSAVHHTDASDAEASRHSGMPCVVCDTDGTPGRPCQAKAIITERWTVPVEVRARRRNRKHPARPAAAQAGKAPQQVFNGHGRSDTRRVDKRGDLPRTTRVLAPQRRGQDGGLTLQRP